MARIIIYVAMCFALISCGSNNKENDDASGSPVPSVTDTGKALLPTISSVRYLHAQTMLEKFFPKDSIFERLLLQNLKYYDQKLPDMSSYQAFYFSVKCVPDTAANFFCPEGFASLDQGFLVLYDKNNSHAKVINVSYSYLGDAFSNDMRYSIDQGNVIRLTETYLTDSIAENGDAITLERTRAEHKIIISPAGDITITKTN